MTLGRVADLHPGGAAAGGGVPGGVARPGARADWQGLPPRSSDGTRCAAGFVSAAIHVADGARL